MKYMGSKARIAKHILPIMLKDRKKDQYYVEPFVGGANLIDKVTGNRIGADINHHLISALKLIQTNPVILPHSEKFFNENDYKLLKKTDPTIFSGLYGYVGFALSYSGKWWGGWCRDTACKRDYVAEAFRNALKQSPKLQNITFICSKYYDLMIPKNSIIYCDPPYQNTTKYKDKFDHVMFWNWVRNISILGHTVFVSEYNAPNDFKIIWKREITSSLTKNTGSKKGIEKLFILNRVNDNEEA